MDNIMDSELASEMVKLLAQELKAVRAQLREAEKRTATTPCGGSSNGITRERAQTLIDENDSLKADNALQERIARLQDELAQVSSIKSEEASSNPLQYPEVPMSHTSGEIARLLAENKDLIREKKEALRNREKLSILEEKYRRTKAKVLEYNEILNELRVALSNCLQELEESKKAVVSEIDFRDYLKDIPYEPVEGQLKLSSIQPYTRALHTKLRKGGMDTCKGPYTLGYNEVIWSPSGIALGLVVKPTFQYNPKAHGGTWTKFENIFDVGKQMDVILLGNKNRYLGTYERVGDQGTMAIAPETLKFLNHKTLEYVSQRTTLFPDLMPPSHTLMIQNMYKHGAFAEELRKKCPPSIQQNLPGDTVVNTSAITSGNVRKRKGNPGSTVHSTKNKKRKH